MADRIVATWDNDSVGHTSQKIYRTLNDGVESLLATLPSNARRYIDNTFKDTDPYDVTYRVTTVGTENGAPVEKTTDSLVVHVRRNFTAARVVITGSNLIFLSASPLVLEIDDGPLIESVPYPGGAGLWQLTHTFQSASDRPGALYSAEEGPMRGLYAFSGLKSILNWYSEGHVDYIGAPGSGTDMKALTLGATLEEVPPTQPPGITDFSFFFYGCTNFSQNLTGWDMSAATNMSNMFCQCTIFNGDITGWNVGNVTDMTNMFGDAHAFDQDISGWNMSNVINVTQMFYNATSFNQNINAWELFKPKLYTRMFKGATAFNQPLNNWDMSDATNFLEMFYGAASFNQNISSWNMRAATTCNGMFYGATAFNQPIGTWNVGNVTDMSYMFFNANYFNQDLSSWCVGLIEDAGPYHTQFAINSGITLSKEPVWGTCPLNNREYVQLNGLRNGQLIATTESYQLSYSTNLVAPTAQWSILSGASGASIDQNGLLTSTVPTADIVVQLVLNNDPFYTTTIQVSSRVRKDKMILKIFSTGGSAYTFFAFPYTEVDWGDGSPIEMVQPGDSYISHTYPSVTEGVEYTVTVGDGLSPLDFRCTNLGLSAITQWPGYGWTNMIVGTGSLTSVPNYLPDAPITFNQTFSGASNLNDPNISLWDTSQVNSMANMFSGCYVFNQPLNNWKVGQIGVGGLNSMFYNCSAFDQDISSWCVTNITSTPYNFSVNSPLTTEHSPVWGTCPTLPQG